MNSIIFEYDTDEGSRTFRIEYRLHTGMPAGLHDPGEPASVELMSIRCTQVELHLDNHPRAERARLVKRQGGVPDSIVSFQPSAEQARQLGAWFERELASWPHVREQVDEACTADAEARRTPSDEYNAEPHRDGTRNVPTTS